MIVFDAENLKNVGVYLLRLNLVIEREQGDGKVLTE